METLLIIAQSRTEFEEAISFFSTINDKSHKFLYCLVLERSDYMMDNIGFLTNWRGSWEESYNKMIDACNQDY